MDKLFYIKIKNQDGTYSDQIPIGALAENVEWDNTHNLDDILGNVHADTPIQTQIDNIQNTKISRLDLNNYIEEKLDEDAVAWLDQHYKDAEILKKGHLEYGEQKATYSSVQPSNVETRQYPVTFDNKNKLSVNVPWTDTVFNPKLDKIWTGTFIYTQKEPGSMAFVLTIKLDNSQGLFPLSIGKTIAVYKNVPQSATLIYLNDTYYPIYIKAKTSNPQYIKMSDADESYFQKIENGYTFLTYISGVSIGNAEPGFILTSANTNLNAIYALQDEKADINSPTFTGEPTAPTPAAGSNNTKIATTAFVQNELIDTLKESHLKSTTKSELVSSSPSDTENRQYPVVFDKNGKLSVNVPWTQDEVASIVQKIWTGAMSGGIDAKEKIVTLDNSKDFSQPINGMTLMLRTEGNNAKSEDGDQLRIKLQIEENETFIMFTHPIVYALTGNQQVVAMTDQLYCKWGPGIRVFTFKVDVNSPSGGYWILQDVSQQTIRQLASSISSLNNLLNSKANLESPIFTGNPKTQTKDKTENSDIIASTKFVHDVVDQEINNTVINLQDEINSLQNNINNTINNLQTNINNSINELQTNINNINSNLFSEINNINAFLIDALPSTTQDITFQNLASTLGNNNVKTPSAGQRNNYWNSNGFTLLSNSETQRKYIYSYKSSITDPYFQYHYEIEGKEQNLLFSFEYMISFDTDFPDSKYPVSILIGSDRYTITNSKIGQWVPVSNKDWEPQKSILEVAADIGSPSVIGSDPKIKFFIQKRNLNYTGNVIITIRKFFIYNLNNTLQSSHQYQSFLKSVVQQQNSNYYPAERTYPYENRLPDKTLSIQNAAADASVVGAQFKGDVLSISSLDNNTISVVRNTCYRMGNFVFLNFAISVKVSTINKDLNILNLVFLKDYSPDGMEDIVLSSPTGNAMLTWSPMTQMLKTNTTLTGGTVQNPVYYFCNAVVHVEQNL